MNVLLLGSIIALTLALGLLTFLLSRELFDIKGQLTQLQGEKQRLDSKLIRIEMVLLTRFNLSLEVESDQIESLDLRLKTEEIKLKVLNRSLSDELEEHDQINSDFIL